MRHIPTHNDRLAGKTEIPVPLARGFVLSKKSGHSRTLSDKLFSIDVHRKCNSFPRISK